MKSKGRDSLFKRQAKKQQKYNFKQRKEQLKYKEAFSQMRKYGRQKK
tara:strand:- start:32 stop:172 length:141 start_codon:yes stop_codon:yes gene_type:complete